MKNDKLFLCIWGVILIIAMIGPYVINILYPKPIVDNPEPINEVVETYGELNDSLAIAEIVSSNNEDSFTIKAIHDEHGNRTYEVITKVVDGNYRIIPIRSNNVTFYILNDDTIKPYAKLKFTGVYLSSISKIELYVPSSYKIESISETDSTEYNIQILDKAVNN